MGGGGRSVKIQTMENREKKLMENTEQNKQKFLHTERNIPARETSKKKILAARDSPPPPIIFF